MKFVAKQEEHLIQAGEVYWASDYRYLLAYHEIHGYWTLVNMETGVASTGFSKEQMADHLNKYNFELLGTWEDVE